MVKNTPKDSAKVKIKNILINIVIPHITLTFSLLVNKNQINRSGFNHNKTVKI